MNTTPPEVPQGEPRRWFRSPDELTATRAKLDALTRWAARKGFPGRLAVDAQPATRSHTPTPGGPTVTVHGFEVTITGEPPCYGGWRFLAAVDTVGDGVVIRYPPGRAAAIDHTGLTPGCCDHCRTTRTRRTTILVQNEGTAEVRQVGRSCLKDFLGWSTLPVFLDAAAVEDQLGLDRSSGRSGPVDLASVLPLAWAVVAEYGWTPTAAASEHPPSTRNLVAEVLENGRNAPGVLLRIAPHLEEGERLAPRIIADLTDAFTATSGYQANLAAILRSGQVDRRHLGLAVSAVAAWQRLQATAEQPAAVEPVRSHVGTVGEQVTLTGRVTTTLRVDGFHWNSPDSVLLILDCGPHVAKLVTAAAWAYEVERGDVLTVTGRVKAHASYRDLPQTVLVRPRLVERTSAGAAADPGAGVHLSPGPGPSDASEASGWETAGLRGTPPSRFPETPLAPPPALRAP